MQIIEYALILWFRDFSFHTIFTCLFSIIVIQVKAIFIRILSTTLFVKISMPKLDRISVDVRARSQNLLNLIQLFGKFPKRYVTYKKIQSLFISHKSGKLSCHLGSIWTANIRSDNNLEFPEQLYEIEQVLRLRLYINTDSIYFLHTDFYKECCGENQYAKLGWNHC